MSWFSGQVVLLPVPIRSGSASQNVSNFEAMPALTHFKFELHNKAVTEKINALPIYQKRTHARMHPGCLCVTFRMPRTTITLGGSVDAQGAQTRPVTMGTHGRSVVPALRTKMGIRWIPKARRGCGGQSPKRFNSSPFLRSGSFQPDFSIL